MLQSGRHNALRAIFLLLIVGGDNTVESARLASMLVKCVDDGRVVVGVASIVG